MKLNKVISVVTCAIVLQAVPIWAETCCQKAAADGKECKDKCCVAAHKQGKSCVKCNPNKEDLKLKRTEKKSDKTARSSKSS